MSLENTATLQKMVTGKASESEPWTNHVIQEFTRRQKASESSFENAFPLIASSIYAEEIVSAVDSVLSC